MKGGAAPNRKTAKVVPLRREVGAELARTKARAERPEGLLVTLARLAQAGGGGLSWANLGRLQSALYFAWHSDDVDDFGSDRRFFETLLPFFEFLYSVWWRVETTGIEHVPGRGPGLIVTNHSGVLPYDGIMVKLAVRHEHPARRECRMLALDMFALLPVLAPLLAKSGEVRANPARRCLRADARANSKLVTFTQAINRTQATAPINTRSMGRTRATVRS